jgi:fluoride ion exporter CrcB/FEX
MASSSPIDPRLAASGSTEYHAANDTLPSDDGVPSSSLPEHSVPSDEHTDALMDDSEAQQTNPYHSIPDDGNALNVGFGSSRNSGPFSGMRTMQLGAHHDQHDEVPSTSSSSISLALHQMRSWASQCNNMMTSSTRLAIVQACYLGVAAMIGTLVRLILAQLFGQACSNPGTIGWIADDAALCVTASGETSQKGGIIFADLPANILGSFVMGLLQDGGALDLAVSTPLAFLKPSHVLQGYDVLHLALKTGFCGSLTTFSGWNSEMVIMLVGTEATHRPSQIWKALLGYIVGIETALGSYVFGRTVAWWLHQWQNPDLAMEQEAMKVRRYQHGIAINHQLPTLERRYLHGLFELHSEDGSWTNAVLVPDEAARKLSPADNLTPEELAPLMRWRDSTKEARRVESQLSHALMELETGLIVNKLTATQEERSLAMKNGWDIAALEVWLAKRYNPQPDNNLNTAGIRKPLSEERSMIYSIPVALLCWSVLIAILIILMIHWDAENAYEITYRTMAYSMIFATPGALLRWTLSNWNGTFQWRDWKWLPIGTLAANVLGAMVSISMIAWDYNLQIAGNSGYWGIATIQAIKIGFSGCLTTVSTFVSEVHKLTSMRQDRGYKYVVITFTLSCVFAMAIFVIVV